MPTITGILKAPHAALITSILRAWLNEASSPVEPSTKAASIPPFSRCVAMREMAGISTDPSSSRGVATGGMMLSLLRSCFMRMDCGLVVFPKEEVWSAAGRRRGSPAFRLRSLGTGGANWRAARSGQKLWVDRIIQAMESTPATTAMIAAGFPARLMRPSRKSPRMPPENTLESVHQASSALDTFSSRNEMAVPRMPTPRVAAAEEPHGAPVIDGFFPETFEEVRVQDGRGGVERSRDRCSCRLPARPR